MKKVGVKKLKDNLSAYLRDVRQGETLVVTDRGQEVARMVPPQPQASTFEERLARAIAEGRITPPSVKSPLTPLPKEPKLKRRLTEEEWTAIWDSVRSDRL